MYSAWLQVNGETLNGSLVFPEGGLVAWASTTPYRSIVLSTIIAQVAQPVLPMFYNTGKTI
ncbi:MAG TPA: hypothetical protein VFA10_09335 [Ktedonobacteraceae bacterium]|nr:hypothetical protein [Ktedonobacteraceae bacterium]